MSPLQPPPGWHRPFTAARFAIPLGMLSLCGALLLSACTAPKRGPTTTPTPNLLVEVRDHTGAPVAKDALKGHWTVMWFYPKAQTSG